MASRVHLIFKTHLDIGFTDHASRVRAQYHQQFIPQAIATGAHFWAEDRDAPAFVWTTGAWLIHDHLSTGTPDQIRALEQAIDRGLIAWHALPFTTHTELMSPALFAAGLSYAQDLDARFGRKTRAAKMTDVPGHTLGMVPLLAAAGIRYLHLGVNTASPVPDVPPIFRWQAPDGSEIVVHYQDSYGATAFPAGPDTGLAFAHTADNIGPQSVPQTAEVWRGLMRELPGADIRASTLDAFGAAMWDRRDSLPVVTAEIGDSWIHGAASDPVKLARFRALQRLYDAFAQDLTPERLAFGRDLAMVAEHTWGVDIKSYLRDTTAWDRPAFDARRATDPRFVYTARSWAEQRAILDQAVAHLAPPDRARAVAALAETTTRPTAPPGGWTMAADPQTGDILRIETPDGTSLHGQNGPLFAFRHESYDAADMQQHMDSYLVHRAEWAVLDHAKPGLETARTAHSATWVPQAAADGFTMPAQARSGLGAPAQVAFHLGVEGPQSALLTLILKGKPANRMPEGGFLHVSPAALREVRIQKMGLWHSDFVPRGGARLQAAEAVQANSGRIRFTLAPLDAPLVGPVTGGFMTYRPTAPDWSEGFRFNLYNNKWGTNFPMWWEGDVQFRFRLSLS